MMVFGGLTCARCAGLAASLPRVRRPFPRAIAFRVFKYPLANLRRDICIVIRGHRMKDTTVAAGTEGWGEPVARYRRIDKKDAPDFAGASLSNLFGFKRFYSWLRCASEPAGGFPAALSNICSLRYTSELMS